MLCHLRRRFAGAVFVRQSFLPRRRAQHRQHARSRKTINRQKRFHILPRRRLFGKNPAAKPDGNNLHRNPAIHNNNIPRRRLPAPNGIKHNRRIIKHRARRTTAAMDGCIIKSKRPHHRPAPGKSMRLVFPRRAIPATIQPPPDNARIAVHLINLPSPWEGRISGCVRRIIKPWRKHLFLARGARLSGL